MCAWKGFSIIIYHFIKILIMFGILLFSNKVYLVFGINMYKIVLTVFVVFTSITSNDCLFTSYTHNNDETGNSEKLVLEDTAISKSVDRWLKDYNSDARREFHNVAVSEWKYYSDMSEKNRNTMIQQRLEKVTFQRISARKALVYLNNKNVFESAVQRQLEKITDIGVGATDSRESFVRAVELEAKEEQFYSNAEVNVDGHLIDNKPDAYSKFSAVEDVDKKGDIWVKIHNSFGDLKPLFAERVMLTNDAIQNLGFRNMAHYWDTLYPGLVLSEVADTLWEQIRPVYELLHAYVKYRLKEYYADGSLLPDTEHIPEHLVGIPGSSGWLDIYDKVKPFTDVADINITKHIRQKMKDVRNIAAKVEEIFVAFGLYIAIEASWNSSLLLKPEATNMSCVPRTINLYDNQARSQICGVVDQCTFFTMFELLGEATRINACQNQSVLFQSEPFPDFGAAIGGLVSLSALTPANMERFDLTESASEGYKSNVNFLFWMALRILPRLANDYAAGKWKMTVYSRWVNESAYNTHWWQSKCRYEGIIPPSIRQNDNFDSGVYIDAWKLSPFYRNMMNLGSSHPWKLVTGEDEIRAQPMLSYFSPLKLWLQGKLSRIDDIQLTNLESNSKSCFWEISDGISLKRLAASFYAFNQLLILSFTSMTL